MTQKKKKRKKRKRKEREQTRQANIYDKFWSDEHV